MNAFEVLQNINSAICDMGEKEKWTEANWFIDRLQLFVICVLWKEEYIDLTTVLNEIEERNELSNFENVLFTFFDYDIMKYICQRLLWVYTMTNWYDENIGPSKDKEMLDWWRTCRLHKNPYHPLLPSPRGRWGTILLSLGVWAFGTFNFVLLLGGGTKKNKFYWKYFFQSSFMTSKLYWSIKWPVI